AGCKGGAGAFRHVSRKQMTTQVWIAILVGVAAVIDDLRRREISNWIPVFALAAGLAWQIGQSRPMGLLSPVGPTIAGFCAFLVFYLVGGMGGGDVKLMAGFGAVLGAMGILKAALWTAGIGGLLAAGVIAFRTLRGVVTRTPAVEGKLATAEEIAYRE